VEIAKVTQSVSKVEEEIHALQPQIEEAARKALERGVDQRYWRKTEELLLKEEELLLKQESLHIVRGEKLKGFLLAQLAGGSLVGISAALPSFSTACPFPPTTRSVRGGLWLRGWGGQRNACLMHLAAH